MCGALLGGVWWIFPLIGFVICAAFMFVAFRFCRTGPGCMCMGGSRNTTHDGAQPASGGNPASR